MRIAHWMLALGVVVNATPSSLVGADPEPVGVVPQTGEGSRDPKVVLREILSRREFAELSRGPTLSERFWAWLEALLRQAARAIGRLFSRLPHRTVAAVAQLVLWFLFVMLAGATLYVVWRLAGGRFGWRRKTQALHQPVRSLRLGDPGELRTRAHDLRAQGKFREALQAYYLMVLAALERRQLVVPDRTRTNWEYYEAVSAKLGEAAPAPQFERLNVIYDRLWYGLRPCAASDVDAFEALSMDLVGTSQR